jgi:hypothetical protein
LNVFEDYCSLWKPKVDVRSLKKNNIYLIVETNENIEFFETYNAWIRLTRIILRPLSALSLDAKRNITTGLFGLRFGNNNEKLGLPERLSSGIQFRFRNLFHGKI